MIHIPKEALGGTWCTSSFSRRLHVADCLVCFYSNMNSRLPPLFAISSGFYNPPTSPTHLSLEPVHLLKAEFIRRPEQVEISELTSFLPPLSELVLHQPGEVVCTAAEVNDCVAIVDVRLDAPRHCVEKQGVGEVAAVRGVA